MKKTILIIALLALTVTAFSQKVYQSGNYGKQKFKNVTVSGVLTDKYTNKGFNWFTLVDYNITYKINVVDTTVFKNAKINERLVLTNCHRAVMTEWKRTVRK